MTRYADYSADGVPVGRCVILPGRLYTPDGPLLFFAAQVALGHGWDVRQVWWEVPDHETDADELAWVEAQLDAAVDGYDGRVLLVAKSLGTQAAARAAELGYDAAWLTPLLAEPDLAAPLLTYPAAQFVLIGSEDPALDRAVYEQLPGRKVLAPGDHVLRVPGDPTEMVRSHESFVSAFDSWLATLSSV